MYPDHSSVSTASPDRSISGARRRRCGAGHACHTEPVNADVPPAPADEIVEILRAAGARFALLHGSRVSGRARPGSDVDVAAWWAEPAPASFEVLLPPRVDLVVLNDAPLELAGPIALDGALLFDDDPTARVRWVATTRKISADELPRMRRSHEEFAEAIRRGR